MSAEPVCGARPLPKITRGRDCPDPTGDFALADAEVAEMAASDAAPLPAWVGSGPVGESDAPTSPAESEESGEAPSAQAVPGVLATAIPIPSATASAPTRPMCIA